MGCLSRGSEGKLTGAGRGVGEVASPCCPGGTLKSRVVGGQGLQARPRRPRTYCQRMQFLQLRWADCSLLLVSVNLASRPLQPPQATQSHPDPQPPRPPDPPQPPRLQCMHFLIRRLVVWHAAVLAHSALRGIG